MKKILILALSSLVMIFSACSDDKPKQTYTVQQAAPQQAYQEPYTSVPQTTIVHDRDSGASDMLLGMAVGSMLSNNNGGRSSSYTTHTTINKTYTSAPHTNPVSSTPTPNISSTTTKPLYRTNASTKVKASSKPKYRVPVKNSYKPSKPAYRSPTIKKSYSASYSKPKYRSSLYKKR